MYGQDRSLELRLLSLVIASRPFRLRSKCSICSRRFESRRWSHWGQALSSGFLDIGRDHPSSLGPVPRIVSTLQCRRVRSTPVSFGKRESSNKLECKWKTSYLSLSLFIISLSISSYVHIVNIWVLIRNPKKTRDFPSKNRILMDFLLKTSPSGYKSFGQYN